MRILHLEASPGWGGQEIRVLRESEGMRAKGHEVVIGVMKGGKLIDEGCKAGFTCYSLAFQKKYWPYTLLKILYLIYKHKIDIINTHSSLDAWIGGIAGKIAKIPVVRTRHLSTPIRKGFNSKILYGFLADFVVTTCAEMVPIITSQSGKDVSKCISIPTGVDPEKHYFDLSLVKSFRDSIQVQDEEILVGTLCFIRSWKGISDFLQAALLLKEVKGLRFVIIGGGHIEKYKKEAASMGLQGIVQFTGHLENPMPALAALDVFTLLSTAHEGVSQAILQAAFFSKPLIATETGGLKEVCIDQKTGIQVPPFSPEKIKDAILQLKEHPSLRKKMGKNGRKLVEEKFLFKSMVDQMEQVYLYHSQ